MQATEETVERPPVPRALALVAFVMFVGGLMSLVEILVQWFIHDRTHPNIGVVGILLAWGLIRYQPTARRLSLLFIWLILLCLPFEAAAVLIERFRTGDSEFPWTGLSFKSFAALVAVAAWMASVLHRKSIRELFDSSKRMHAAPPGPWQFRLRHGFIAVAVAACLFTRLAQDDVVYNERSEGTESRTRWKDEDGNLHVDVVSCAYRFREYRFINRDPVLKYAVFYSTRSGLQIISDPRFAPSAHRARLLLPGEAPIDLPAPDWQLAECFGRGLRTSDQRVTYRELQSFLQQESAASSWSIAKLIAFRDRRHAEYEAWLKQNR